MEQIKGEITSGVVAELNGLYWGLQWEDGHSSYSGFGPIDKAGIYNPDVCLKPEDMTYKRSPQRKELAKAILRKVSKITIFDLD